jgi:hypothetical protein
MEIKIIDIKSEVGAHTSKCEVEAKTSVSKSGHRHQNVMELKSKSEAGHRHQDLKLRHIHEKLGWGIHIKI